MSDTYNPLFATQSSIEPYPLPELEDRLLRPSAKEEKPMTTSRIEEQDRKDLKIAKRIAEYLFVNGQRQEAKRLVLTSSKGKDLGGWCKKAVVDIIVKQLKESR